AQALGQATTGEAYTEDDISTLNRENSSGTSGDPVDPATGSSHETATDSGGSLPFTGLDIVLIAVAGVLLATVGFGMWRLTRAPDTA
ncbi:MAG TPA: hypothetical protein VGR10_00565, partial [Thermoleophilaceae bacterium]|nr:hypothetical protein [Thermoleophilaceae bacterium]